MVTLISRAQLSGRGHSSFYMYKKLHLYFFAQLQKYCAMQLHISHHIRPSETDTTLQPPLLLGQIITAAPFAVIVHADFHSDAGKSLLMYAHRLEGQWSVVYASHCSGIQCVGRVTSLSDAKAAFVAYHSFQGQASLPRH